MGIVAIDHVLIHVRADDGFRLRRQNLREVVVVENVARDIDALCLGRQAHHCQHASSQRCCDKICRRKFTPLTTIVCRRIGTEDHT